MAEFRFHPAAALVSLCIAASAQPGPKITTTSLPNGSVGLAYNQTMAANGGKQPYSWSVASGSFPNGLHLASSGVVSGTPSTAGTSNVTVEVSDANKMNDTQALAVTVTAALAITTASLPNGTVGTAYSQTLAATGGSGGYTWSVSAGAGALPQGLTLSAAGVISGTPTAAGTASFTVQVKDSSGTTATAALSIAVGPALSITTASLPNGTVGTAYSQTLAATGGSGGYTWSASGSLPQGLTLSAAGAISGTPSAAGTANFMVHVKDSSGTMASAPLSIAVSPAPVTITTGSLPNGTVGTAYSQTLTASGGTGGYTWSVSAGSLPQGLTLSAAGAISGTPSAAGTASFTVQVKDSSGTPATAPLTIAVNPAPVTITTGSLPNGTVGTAYSQTLAASGGTGGYTWSVSAGSLPQGLTLSAAGAISGTPSAAGTASFTVQVKDSSGTTAAAPLSIAVSPAALTITTASLPNGTVGAVYSQTLAASGGTGGYTWSVTAGSLPQGLTLSAAGLISGTPSTAQTVSFTVQVKDSSGTTASNQIGIVVYPAAITITTSSLPNGTVGTAYSQTLAATGGAGGFTWSVIAGSLPQGLTLSAAGAISGTPSAAGTASFTVQVKDSSGVTATAALSIVVTPPPLTITTTSLPNGMVGTAYSQTLAANGGTGGYTWSVSTGSLPQGLTLSAAGAISGTPSAAGAASFTVQVKDNSGTTATAALGITVSPAQLTITTSSLPNGMVGAVYSQTLAANGGAGGNAWSVSAGSLPQGLTLSAAGAISGTPSAAGTANFTVQVKDSSGTTATAALSIVVSPASLTITSSALANGTTGASYSQSLTATGGAGAYTWSITTGTLPPGLSLNPAGSFTGTPTTAGTFNFTVQVQDSSGVKATKALTITIGGATITITSSSTLPSGTAGVAYSATLTATGGVFPYTWILVAGQLPPGLTLAPTGAIGGTPGAGGNFTFGFQVSDSSGAKAVGQASLSIRGAPAISTPSVLASGAVGSPYSQAISVTGGTAPYTWALSSGALPGGLSFSTSTGTISGTPSQAGTFQIAITVTDAASATASGNFSLTVANGLIISTAPTLPAATVGVAYSLALGAAGGAAPYQWSITTGALPAGLTFSATGQLSGTPTAAGNFAFTAQAIDATSLKVSKNFTLAVAGALSITSAPSLPGAATGAPYQQALSVAGGTPPYVWSVTAGALPGGLNLDSSAGSLSGTPTAVGTFNFTVTVTDSNSVAAQQAFSITVVQGLSVTAPAALPDATAGSAYSYTLSAGGGKQPYTWAITQGALPAGLALDPSSGAISGTPTAGGSFVFTVQVTDAGGLNTTRAETLPVDLPTLQGLQIAGLPSTIASAQQPLIDVGLGNAYPVAVSGVLNLTFTPSNNAPDDPSVQFSTGGRSASFTIPAGATHATFPAPQFAIQTGSVAGTISIAAASLQSGGMTVPMQGNVTVSVQVTPAAPTIQNVSVTQTSGGFQVALVGLSNTRELTQATVTFQASAGNSLQTGSLVVPLSSVSQTWFQGASSTPYGGQFTLTIPFTVNGGSNAVGGVSVVLSNSVGNSTPVGSQ